MRVRKLVALLIVASAIAVAWDGVEAFSALKRNPSPAAAQVKDPAASYLGVTIYSGTYPKNTPVTIATVYNNGTAPLTFTTSVVSDPNSIVTNLAVSPTGPVPVGGHVLINMTATGSPGRDYDLIFKVVGRNPGTHVVTLNNLQAQLRLTNT